MMIKTGKWITGKGTPAIDTQEYGRWLHAPLFKPVKKTGFSLGF